MKNKLKLFSTVGLLALLGISNNLRVVNSVEEKSLELRDVLAADFSNESGKKVEVKKANQVDTYELSEVYVQQKETAEATYSLRFLVGINTLNVDNVTFSFDVGGKVATKATTKAYHSIEIAGSVYNASEVVGHEYAVAVIVSGLTNEYLDSAFVASASAFKQETEVVAAESKIFDAKSIINYDTLDLTHNLFTATSVSDGDDKVASANRGEVFAKIAAPIDFNGIGSHQLTEADKAEAIYQNGEFVFDYKGNYTWVTMQMFYRPLYTEGTAYYIFADVTADHDDVPMQVNGKHYLLKKGVNKLVLHHGVNPYLSIQMGYYDAETQKDTFIPEAKVVFSNVAMYEDKLSALEIAKREKLQEISNFITENTDLMYAPEHIAILEKIIKDTKQAIRESYTVEAVNAVYNDGVTELNNVPSYLKQGQRLLLINPNEEQSGLSIWGHTNACVYIKNENLKGTNAALKFTFYWRNGNSYTAPFVFKTENIAGNGRVDFNVNGNHHNKNLNDEEFILEIVATYENVEYVMVIQGRGNHNTPGRYINQIAKIPEVTGDYGLIIQRNSEVIRLVGFYNNGSEYAVYADLKAGDLIRMINLSNSGAFGFKYLENGGKSASFTRNEDGSLRCNEDGHYDFYLKLAMGHDGAYIG